MKGLESWGGPYGRDLSPPPPATLPPLYMRYFSVMGTAQQHLIIVQLMIFGQPSLSLALHLSEL
jgi:hypothetical protein